MENFETFRLDQTGQQTQAILDQVSTNTADIAQLRALYEALTQSEPVIIQPSDTWPVADPQENVIYRVIDRVNTPPQSYSDYMWNGTAMVLMATYNNSIDNEPTPGSNSLVKSGGVAASIVFDISAYHATGSTLATYANLAAALGTDGANVPASVRKGGMSVKFVKSSDNKYVQCRLMSDSFNTTPANWQGVDDEPTAESQNIANSGGVYRKTGPFGLNCYDELWEVGDISDWGEPISGSTTLRTVNFIKCYPSTKYGFSKYCGYIYYYNINKQFISFSQIGTNVITTLNNAYYFKIVLFSSYGTVYNNDIKIFQENNWKPELKEVDTKVDNYTLNSILDEQFEIGDIDASGIPDPGENNTLRTINFSKCYPGTLYKVTSNLIENTNVNSTGIIYFYDKNYKFIELKNIYRNGDYFEATSSNTARYFKIVLATDYGTTYNNDIKVYQKGGIGENIVDLQKYKFDTEIYVEWEKGDIGSSNGYPVVSRDVLRTKNYINCSFIKISIDAPVDNNGNCAYLFCYGRKYNYLGYSVIQPGIIKPLENTCFFKIVLLSQYGSIYNNDVIIKGVYNLGNGLSNIEQYTANELVSNYHLLKMSWEIGDLDSNSGIPVPGENNTLRNTDYINCSKYSHIIAEGPQNQSTLGIIYYYNSTKTFIGYDEFKQGFVGINKYASFFKIVLASSYGTTYNNDVNLIAYYKNHPYRYIVSKDGTGDFDSVTEAVSNCCDGDAIFIKRGVYDNETIRAWQKNLIIIGEDRYGVQIMGAGDYLNPPLEMNSGVLKNVSIYAYGETASPSGRYAYAIHADANILANNTFIVENCTLKTKMGHGAVGMGMRGGCYVRFSDCDFISEHKTAFFLNETVTALNQMPGDQHIEFNNCKFIALSDEYSATGNFEGYHSRGGFVYITFINNVFVHANRTPEAYFYWPQDQSYWDPQCENIEGNIIVDGQGTKMINWFITEQSYGNNIQQLNRSKQGTLNGRY